MKVSSTLEEWLAEQDGISIESFRADAELRSRISSLAESHLRKRPSDWPILTFNWDLSSESQHFALDGCKPDAFSKAYPVGLIAGQVEMRLFDAALCHFNRRDDLEELWECGFESKLAYLIAYLAEGLPITPPLVAVTPQNEICFVGGNHRYTAAKFSGQKTLFIYAERSTANAIDQLVPVQWVDT